MQYNQLDLAMHPVIQRLLLVKWDQFAKWGSWFMVSLNMFYTLIWTVLGIMIPRDRKYYSPIGETWWRLALEMIGVILTCVFIYMVSCCYCIDYVWNSVYVVSIFFLLPFQLLLRLHKNWLLPFILKSEISDQFWFLTLLNWKRTINWIVNFLFFLLMLFIFPVKMLLLHRASIAVHPKAVIPPAWSLLTCARCTCVIYAKQEVVLRR